MDPLCAPQDNILMADPANPHFKIAWEGWAAKSRAQLETAAVGTNWHAGGPAACAFE